MLLFYEKSPEIYVYRTINALDIGRPVEAMCFSQLTVC